MIQINDTKEKLTDLDLLLIERSAYLQVLNDFPIDFMSWFTLVKLEREIAVKYSIYYPTKYPFGFNWIAKIYITRHLK